MSDSSDTLDTPALGIESGLVRSLKEWLAVCDSQHAETCASPCLAMGIGAQRSTRPSWLIDVKEQRIVSGSVQANYLALSYTWQDTTKEGNEQEPLQLQRHNLDALGDFGTLGGHSAKLPKVIRDAMELTLALGERYLWVDRLCIIQDGPQKKTEIDRMDQIYQGAHATIAGAADCGLYEQPGETMSTAVFSAPQDWSLLFARSDAAKLKRRAIVNYKRLSKSRWAHRAWTYQEYILSKRVVFFINKWVFWQCECAVWDLFHLRPQQNYAAVVVDRSMSTLLNPLFTPTSSDFSLYTDLICPYNGRDLSHEEDGLSACSGILNRLVPSFPDGFLFGLPRLYLDHALLWQPLQGCYDDLRPNTSLNQYGGYGPSDGCPGRTGPSTRRPTLPSWTWAGWQCFVDPRSLNSASDLAQHGDFRGLRSIVTWEYPAPTHEPTETDRILIESRVQQKTTKSPQWPRNNEPVNLTSLNHISACVAVEWFLPAAILEIRIEPRYHQRSGFLSFCPNPVLTEKPLSKMPKVVVIRDQASRYSGLLRLTGGTTCKRGKAMELMAISSESTTREEMAGWFEEKVFQRSRYCHPDPFYPVYDCDEWWVDSSDNPIERGSHQYRVVATDEYEEILKKSSGGYEQREKFEYYNVLWIVRGDDNIAYRAGCGRIFKQSWEDNSPAKTRVILG